MARLPREDVVAPLCILTVDATSMNATACIADEEQQEKLRLANIDDATTLESCMNTYAYAQPEMAPEDDAGPFDVYPPNDGGPRAGCACLSPTPTLAFEDSASDVPTRLGPIARGLRVRPEDIGRLVVEFWEWDGEAGYNEWLHPYFVVPRGHSPKVARWVHDEFKLYGTLDDVIAAINRLCADSSDIHVFSVYKLTRCAEGLALKRWKTGRFDHSCRTG